MSCDDRQSGMVHLEAKEHQGPPAAPEARSKARNRFSSGGFRERGPADTMMSSFKPPELREMSLVSSDPACGILFQQSRENNRLRVTRQAGRARS